MFLIILYKNTNIKVTRYQIKIWESSGLGLLRAKTHSEILIKPSHEMIKHGLYEKNPIYRLPCFGSFIQQTPKMTL